MCTTAISLATTPRDIEFVSYHDTDDETKYDYVGNHKEVFGPRVVLSQTWNECQKIATGPIYMFIADDFVFQSEGWDEIVRSVFEKSVDKILFAYPDSSYARKGFGMTGFLHKNWVDSVGYIFPPSLGAFLDNWVNCLADLTGRKHYLENVKVIHEYIVNDKTHNGILERDKTRNDRQRYARLKNKRYEDVEKLKNTILSYNATGTMWREY